MQEENDARHAGGMAPATPEDRDVRSDLDMRPDAPGTLLAGYDLSMEAMAARMLARHQSSVRIKKAHVATARLAVIVETTLQLSNRTGFQSMSLRDLSEHSGLSMGALYAYFDSKDTLLRMILDTVSSLVDEILAVPPPLPPRAHLAWLLGTHVALTEALLPWFTFAYMEAKTFPIEARAMAVASEEHTESLIAQVLARGQREGSFDIADTRMSAALIKPMLQDWYVKRSKYRRRGIAPSDFTRALIDFVERAILPRTSA